MFGHQFNLAVSRHYLDSPVFCHHFDFGHHFDSVFFGHHLDLPIFGHHFDSVVFGHRFDLPISDTTLTRLSLVIIST